MMTKEEAIAIILAHGVAGRRASEVPLSDARGRALAADVSAGSDFPPFDKSTMDGYAVAALDVASPTILPVSGRIVAGMEGAPLQRGTAAKIMTGAPLPPGADAVLPVEDTAMMHGGSHVELRRAVKPWQNVARRGEDFRKGDVVVARGTIMDAPVLALLAMLGRDPVPSFTAPRVCVVPTGDELVPPGDAIVQPGAIYESNGTLLESQLLEVVPSLRVTRVGIARDNRASLNAFFDVGLDHDVLVLSGGVSMGDLDLVGVLLKERGLRVAIEKVSIKPGKPFLFGDVVRTDGHVCTVFGLPGNPVSSCVTMELFVRPWLLARLGSLAPLGATISARLRVDRAIKAIPRTQHVPATLRVGADGATVSPVRWNGSGDLRGLAQANALAVLPMGTVGQDGDVVDVIMLPRRVPLPNLDS